MLLWRLVWACWFCHAVCVQVLSDAAKTLWRRYSAKAKELKQSVHTVRASHVLPAEQLAQPLS